MMKLQWRFGIIAGLFLALFSLYPQMKMMYVRGGEWNGNYAYNDIDEMAYSAYLRALIDGRPRKNDPYTGIVDSAETPQKESLFSIQFAVPYSVAILARLFGVNTQWTMIISGALAAFFSGLAVFWLLGTVLRDSFYAFAGTLFIFCFGALAAGEGAALEIFSDGIAYPFFPAFRRYIPALAMPAFFAFVVSVWKIFEVERIKFGMICFSVLCFSWMVYGYFYLWTASLAWLALFIILRVGTGFITKDHKHYLKTSVLLLAGMFLSLLPYFWLLSRRAAVIDEVQLLASSNAPDIFRMPVYIGIIVVIIISALCLKKFISYLDDISILIISLALLPFAALNQQIITGYSLQPIHYAIFIGNYAALLSLILTAGLIFKNVEKPIVNKTLRRSFVGAVAFIAIFWGMVEAHYTTSASDHMNNLRDESYPVAKRIEQLAADSNATILSYDMVLANEIPSASGQNVLWAHHQQIFTGLDGSGHRSRFFFFMYYSGADGEMLKQSLRGSFVASAALFGWGRHTDRLTVDSRPLSEKEIDDVAAEFDSFIADFSFERVAEVELSYVVVMNDRHSDLSNLEKWYELDQGETVGRHTIYRSTLRNEIIAP